MSPTPYHYATAVFTLVGQIFEFIKRLEYADATLKAPYLLISNYLNTLRLYVHMYIRDRITEC